VITLNTLRVLNFQTDGVAELGSIHHGATDRVL